MKPGHFVGFTQQANLKEFDMRFKQYKGEDKEIPIVRKVTPEDLEINYERIFNLVQSL